MAAAGLRIVARVGAAVLGTYAAAAGTAALVAVLLVATAGMSRSDALILGSFTAYLLFALLMLWCFAERRLARVWWVLLAAAALTHGAALLVARAGPIS